MTEPLDFYKTLQVDPQAEPEVIQAAYRRLARKYHPDLANDDGAAQRMSAINRAWEVLRDPDERARYDRERASTADAGARPPFTSGDRKAPERPSGPTRPPGWDSGRPPHAGQSGRAAPEPPPKHVSRDWTAGRSSFGGGYDARTMRAPEGHGAAGPPPGNPSGSVLNFSRYAGWSLGEIARHDPDFLEWLDRTPIGRPYRDEIDQLLRRLARRRSAPPDQSATRGLFRRR